MKEVQVRYLGATPFFFPIVEERSSPLLWKHVRPSRPTLPDHFGRVGEEQPGEDAESTNSKRYILLVRTNSTTVQLSQRGLSASGVRFVLTKKTYDMKQLYVIVTISLHERIFFTVDQYFFPHFLIDANHWCIFWM